ncbi:erythromycin esterase [Cytobacillus oceanisediminis]|uniref:Erythromycin esterase n=1 Tax=Cytobacillus oceanisediminis TaxID=665099 RepID=A0A2V2ZQN5_9BACI|nr:erythromycin esterase family protein [Cytobacillus oceanisediminis]PWW26651.1 erythromycin esterase [Cytobacillus oceanisediminis]
MKHFSFLIVENLSSYLGGSKGGSFIKKFVSLVFIVFVILTLIFTLSPVNKENPLDNNSIIELPLGSSEEIDFSFLKTLLEDKRIVFLGESSHGVAEFNEIKVDMIMYLHKELGFEIVAFESNLGDAIAVQNSVKKLAPKEMLRGSLPGVWVTEEVLSLFQYIKETSLTDSPLILSGVDVRPTHFFNTWFEDLLSKIGDSSKNEYRKIVEQCTAFNLMYSAKPAKEREDCAVRYDNLLSIVKKNENMFTREFPDFPELLSLVELELNTRISYVRNYPDSDAPIEQQADMRDQMMSTVLKSLFEDVFPNKKIIVWGHNDHIRDQNSKVDVAYVDGSKTIISMTERLPETIKMDSYIIGLYMGSGKTAGNDRTVHSVNEEDGIQKDGTLENILSRGNYDAVFAELSHAENNQENKWMFQSLEALSWGYHREYIPNIRENYDAIIYIKEVNPPLYLK